MHNNDRYRNLSAFLSIRNLFCVINFTFSGIRENILTTKISRYTVIHLVNEVTSELKCGVSIFCLCYVVRKNYPIRYFVVMPAHIQDV